MKITTTAARLQQLMQERGLKQVDILEKARPVCNKYGRSARLSDLSQYVSGKVAPGQDKLSVLGLALNVNEAWLMGYDAPMQRTVRVLPADTPPPGLEPLPEMATVPLIGDIACGTPITAEQNVVDRIGVPASWRADYALTCHGDSMAPKIQDGDIVCVRCQPVVENGEIAVVLIDGEATLKRFYRQGDTVTLMPENLSACTPLVYQGTAINDLCIEGKAVGICRAV